MNTVKAFSAASAICINQKHAATIMLTLVELSVNECTLDTYLDVS